MARGSPARCCTRAKGPVQVSADTRVGAGALLEVLLAIPNMATAVVLYRIARRIHERRKRHVTLRVIEGAVVLPTAAWTGTFRRTPCLHVAGLQPVSPTTNVC